MGIEIMMLACKRSIHVYSQIYLYYTQVVKGPIFICILLLLLLLLLLFRTDRDYDLVQGQRVGWVSLIRLTGANKNPEKVGPNREIEMYVHSCSRISFSIQSRCKADRGA